MLRVGRARMSKDDKKIFSILLITAAGMERLKWWWLYTKVGVAGSNFVSESCLSVMPFSPGSANRLRSPWTAD